MLAPENAVFAQLHQFPVRWREGRLRGRRTRVPGSLPWRSKRAPIVSKAAPGDALNRSAVPEPSPVRSRGHAGPAGVTSAPLSPWFLSRRFFKIAWKCTPKMARPQNPGPC